MEIFEKWVKGCAHCVSNIVRRSRKCKIYFSWPVTTPFYIMHINIWSPGHLIDKNSTRSTIQLMKSRCEHNQFVIYSVVRNINAEGPANKFMEDVALSFGTTSVVVVDADSKFRSILEEMCTALKIHFYPLAQGNHKGLLVEKYHRYFYKNQTIAGKDCGTHISILQNGKTLQYAWNSAPTTQ